MDHLLTLDGATFSDTLSGGAKSPVIQLDNHRGSLIPRRLSPSGLLPVDLQVERIPEFLNA